MYYTLKRFVKVNPDFAFVDGGGGNEPSGRGGATEAREWGSAPQRRGSIQLDSATRSLFKWLRLWLTNVWLSRLLSLPSCLELHLQFRHSLRFCLELLAHLRLFLVLACRSALVVTKIAARTRPRRSAWPRRAP